MVSRTSRHAPWASLAGVLGWLLVSHWAAARPQQSWPSDRVVITVAGDTLPESSWSGPQEAEHFLEGAREEFGRADLVFLNLEEPITTADTVTPNKDRADVAAGRDYVLRARNPTLPRIFKEAGVGLVGLANNHMMDYTATGLRDTLRAFQAAELPVVGAGLKPDAERAFVFEKRGWRVALLAFSDVVPTNYQATETSWGIASSKDEKVLAEAIQRARREADFTVLMIHWGGQGKHLITPRQRQLARVAAAAGCDAVVGMHPHVLQGIEYVGRVPVFYSIGNFAFPSSRPAARECVIVRLIFLPRELEAVELVPVEISPAGAPQVVKDTPRGREILARLDGFCRMFNTQVREGKLVRSVARGRLIYDAAPRRATRGSSRAGRSSAEHRSAGTAREERQ